MPVQKKSTTRQPKELDAISGRVLRRLRERAGLNQEELRAAMKFKSTGTISQYERGLCGMRKSNVLKLAKFFNVHPSIFYLDDEFTDQDIDDIVDYMRMIKEKRNDENRSAIRQLINLK